MMARRWNAKSYDRIGGPMTKMASVVLDRLPLVGSETVMDAGCGTGRVTQLLLERVPRGRVIAIDADPEMIRVARENLGDRADIWQCDLADLPSDVRVDAVFSTATFHWILDHDRLFAQLYSVLRPGGRLVAQCGGRGNIAELRSIADSVASNVPFAPYFENWSPPWYYPGPEETADRLMKAGFTDVRTWLEPWPVVPDDPSEYIATVTLGAQVQCLPERLRSVYLAEVINRLDAPVTVDYVRLNIDARRSDRPDESTSDVARARPE
jgi:trans-aconitate 2-methyltransferase